MTKIRFGKETIHHIPYIPINTIEKSQAFYTTTEYQIIVKDRSIDILKSKCSTFIEDVDYSVRGLERFSRTMVGYLNILTPKDFVCAILLEQKRLADIDKRNDLSEFCRYLSYFHLVEARERGVQDEKSVLECHSTPPKCIFGDDLEIDKLRARAA
jgi:hypothetical protein